MLPAEYLQWMKQFISNTQEKKYEYLISRSKNSLKYFYYDFDWIGATKDDTFQLIWTPTRRLAFSFDSEQEVEEFKAEYVSPRKASIIRVIKPPHSMIDLMG